MPQILFVYGTLKRGHCRAGFLAGQQFLGLAYSAPRYRLLDCGSYPGLVDAESDGVAIEGELWAVDDACLTILDREEEIDAGLYSRREVELTRLPSEHSPERNPGVQAYFFEGDTSGLRNCGNRW